MIAQLIHQQAVLDGNFAGAVLLSIPLLVATLVIVALFNRYFGARSYLGRACLRPRQAEGSCGPHDSAKSSSLSPAAWCSRSWSFRSSSSCRISFSTTGGIEFPPPGYDLTRYIAFFHSEDWVAATLLSARVAFFATVLAIPVGVALALGMVRGRFRGKGLLNGLLLGPLIVPIVIYALALFFFYRRVDLFDRELGLVLTYSVVSLPYLVLVTAARLKSFDEALEVAAMSLGASWGRALWYVTLPLTWTGVLAGSLLAFIHSFDELLIALFVTGYKTETPAAQNVHILHR